MAVPFGLGKILDAIYSSDTDSLAAKEKLKDFCIMLGGIFIIGGFANFGRVYLFNNACEFHVIIKYCYLSI
jgi:ATP-binding cassette subfamily B (MDR/TAP) protein 10